MLGHMGKHWFIKIEKSIKKKSEKSWKYQQAVQMQKKKKKHESRKIQKSKPSSDNYECVNVDSNS